jgi:hypothetical protein
MPLRLLAPELHVDQISVNGIMDCTVANAKSALLIRAMSRMDSLMLNREALPTAKETEGSVSNGVPTKVPTIGESTTIQ